MNERGDVLIRRNFLFYRYHLMKCDFINDKNSEIIYNYTTVYDDDYDSLEK